MVNRNRSRQTRLKNTGFSLIELMVSMIVALLILAAVTSIFVSMLNSNNDNLKSMRLNQDLRAVMSLMTRNLRRAGVDLESAAHSITSPVTANPFQVEGTGNDQVTDITVNEAGTANKCITFAYDEPCSNTDVLCPPRAEGVRDSPSELFGYRWDEANETVEIRQNAATCAASIDWEDVTDNTLTLIKDLSFTETLIPVAPVGGEAQVLQITIILTGELKSDATVTRTLRETINIRNN